MQTIEREETIQEANEEAAAIQDDSSQINNNRVDEGNKEMLRASTNIEKRDPHSIEQNVSHSLVSNYRAVFACFICTVLRRILY